ncbi:MAG: hypothetical protein ACQES8_05095 [Thermodesulfobacteriota bacterium]
MKAIMATIQGVLFSALPAFATEEAGQGHNGPYDHSGLLVWVFLGLCVLIILAQAGAAHRPWNKPQKGQSKS